MRQNTKHSLSKERVMKALNWAIFGRAKYDEEIHERYERNLKNHSRIDISFLEEMHWYNTNKVLGILARMNSDPKFKWPGIRIVSYEHNGTLKRTTSIINMSLLSYHEVQVTLVYHVMQDRLTIDGYCFGNNSHTFDPFEYSKLT